MRKEKNIQMVDLHSQYLDIKEEVDREIQGIIDSSSFINGEAVSEFEKLLGEYHGIDNVISCGNGTDALQIALMALGLDRGDKVMVPAFTYVATAEVIALLGLKPEMVDVDSQTFNMTPEIVEKNMSPGIKAIVPVNLFGQSVDIEGIMNIAAQQDIPVVLDNAQSIGAEVKSKSGHHVKSGVLADIACTSFYPSKNLGAYGDGGAILTRDNKLGKKIRMISNHGQSEKYIHDIIGCNSRLDSIQAAVLKVKLPHLDKYCEKRRLVADSYDEKLSNITGIETPFRTDFSTHVFHQYTLKVKGNKRDELKKHLSDHGIPSMIYYPIPLYKQKAYHQYEQDFNVLPVTEKLCGEVLSLPMHPYLTRNEIDFITSRIKEFYG